MANAKSQTPLSVDPKLQRLIGIIMSNLRVTQDAIVYCNSHAEFVRDVLAQLNNTPKIHKTNWEANAKYDLTIGDKALCKKTLKSITFLPGEEGLIIKNLLIGKVKRKISLVVTSPRDLGIYGSLHEPTITLGYFFKVAKDHDLGFCPPETAISFIANYTDELKKHNLLHIGMKPVFFSNHHNLDPRVFMIDSRTASRIQLCAEHGFESTHISVNSAWLFVKKR